MIAPLAALGFGVWLVASSSWSRARRLEKCCRSCQYDMGGTPGLRCPECGRMHGSDAELRPRGGGKVRMVVGATVLTMTLPLAVGVFYAKMVGVSGAPTVLLALGLTVLDSPDARLLAEIGTRVDAALPASDGLDWASRRLVRRYVERTLLHSSPFPSSDLKRWQNPVGNYWPDRYLDCMDLAVRLDSPSGRPARTILLGLRNPNQDSRHAILTRLDARRIGGPDVAAAVIPLLTSSESWERERARSIALNGPDDFNPHIGEFSQSILMDQLPLERLLAFDAEGACELLRLARDDRVGHRALRALAMTEHHRDWFLPELTDIAEAYPHAGHRTYAILALGKLFSSSKVVHDLLPRLCRHDTDGEARFTALWCLGRVGVDPSVLLREVRFALVDDYGRVRWLAVELIGKRFSSDADAIDALKTLINDEDDQVRYSAKTVLARIDALRELKPAQEREGGSQDIDLE